MFTCHRQLFRGLKTPLFKPLTRCNFSHQTYQLRSGFSLKGIAITGFLGAGYQTYKAYASASPIFSDPVGGMSSSTAPDRAEPHDKTNETLVSVLEEEAIKLSKEANDDQSYQSLLGVLKGYSEICGENSSAMASLYHKVGHNFLKRRKHQEAQEHLQKASDISIAQENFTEGVKSLKALALSYIATDFKKAEELLNKAITLQAEKLNSSEGTLLFALYMNWAFQCCTQQLKDAAVEKLDIAFNLPKHAKFAAFALCLQVLYAFLYDVLTNGIVKKYADMFMRSVNRDVLKRDAEKYSKQKNYEKSIECYNQVLEEYEKEENPSQLEIANIHASIAREHEKLKDFDSARNYFEKSSNILLNLNKNEQAVGVRMRGCLVYPKAEYYNKRIECLGDTFIIASERLGPEHRYTTKLREDLELHKKESEVPTAD